MLPEQSGAKDGRPTKESDIYALGILIYEVGTFFAILSQHLRHKGQIDRLWAQYFSRTERVGRGEQVTGRGTPRPTKGWVHGFSLEYSGKLLET
jgi:hypothetical protein